MRRMLRITAVWVLAVSCMKNTDFSGFLYSPYDADTRFIQSDSLNKNQPGKSISISNTSYTFCVGADLHIGGLQNYRTFLQAINSTSVNFYCLVGDITTGHKEDYDKLDTFLTFNDTIRHFFTCGNHELYFKGWTSYFRLFGSSTYMATVNVNGSSDLLIFLDSGNGTLGAKQTTWLEDILNTYRPMYRHCFVFTHTNLFREHNTTSTNFLPEEVYHLLDLFTQHKISMVFMGHDHRHVVETFGPTTYITLDAMLDGFNSASYLECTVDGAKITYKFIPLH